MSFLAVFFAGVVSSVNPCVIVTYPIIISYVGGYSDGSARKAFWSSLFFVIGLSITYSILGTIAALTGRLLGDIGGYWKYILGATAIFMGLNLLGVLNFNLPSGLNFPVKLKGSLGALILGLLFGVTASACSTPILGVVLAYVASKQNISHGAALLFAYALGSSLIIFAVGASTGFAQANLKVKRLEKISALFPKLAGIVFVIVGIWYVIM